MRAVAISIGIYMLLASATFPAWGLVSQPETKAGFSPDLSTIEIRDGAHAEVRLSGDHHVGEATSGDNRKSQLGATRHVLNGFDQVPLDIYSQIVRDDDFPAHFHRFGCASALIEANERCTYDVQYVAASRRDVDVLNCMHDYLRSVCGVEFVSGELDGLFGKTPLFRSGPIESPGEECDNYSRQSSYSSSVFVGENACAPPPNGEFFLEYLGCIILVICLGAYFESLRPREDERHYNNGRRRSDKPPSVFPK